jgi:hypothetical protein
VESKPDREYESGQTADETGPPDTQDRRDVVRRLGRFAAYAAPFTVLAVTSKALTSSGPGPHARQH